MEEASIFIIRTHGAAGPGYTSVSLGNSSLMSSEIYIYNISCVETDLSGMELIVFAACDTANPTAAHNLVDASIMAGADCAIGFNAEIYPTETNDWVDAFLEARFNQGKSIHDSINDANEIAERLENIVYVAYGN